MKLIDKAALVAEIEKRKNENLECATKAGQGYFSARAMEDLDILSSIDTLEVKEVDFHKELLSFYRHTNDSGSKIALAKHFFELGIKAQKGEEL